MAEALSSIIVCPQCGAKNRVNERVAAERQPVCGKCGTKLSASSSASSTSPGTSSTPSQPVEVTDDNFEQVLSDAGDRPLLIDCWAEWCPPCRALAPTIDQLARESAGRWVIGKLDTMTNPGTTARFDTSRIPVMYIFKRGQLVDQLLGAQPKAVIEAKLSRQV